MRLQRLTGLERDKILEEYAETEAADRALPRRSSPTSARCRRSSSTSCRSCKRSTATRAAREIVDEAADDLDRGPDRRRGHGRHDLPRGLHQAERRCRSTARSGAAGGARSARRRATRTSSSTCSSPRRTPTSCSSRPRARSTGSRCTRCRRPGAPRAARRSSTCSNLKPDEKLSAFLPVREFQEDRFVLFATKQRRGEEDRPHAVLEPARRRASSPSRSRRATR